MSDSLTSEKDLYQGFRRQASLLALVVVNLIPLLGVLLFDWDVAVLVILYWSENLVIGFYTLLKMLVHSPVAGLGLGAFFLVHYGGFCAGHGVFIMALLVDSEFELFLDNPWPLFLAFAALFVSHGISFVLNFLRGPEREGQTLNALMRAPYGRIVVLHIAIILGGIAVAEMGEPVAMLVVLVLLKLGMDVGLHLRQHRQIAA